MLVCDLGTEIFIKIIRTIHIISERKPALLTYWLLMRIAHAKKYTDEIGKKKYVVFIRFYCLIWEENPLKLNDVVESTKPMGIQKLISIGLIGKGFTQKVWEKSCPMSKSISEKAMVCLGNGVQESPQGRRIMTLCGT